MIGPRRRRVPIRGIVKRRFPSGKISGPGWARPPRHALHDAWSSGGIHPTTFASWWSLAGGPCFPLSRVPNLSSHWNPFQDSLSFLTCCYVVVVIPYYLSLGRVGGKGDWGEGHRASGLGCTTTGRRTTAVGSYTASASIDGCRSVAMADSPGR